jgi:hypothetical protein
MIKKIILTVSYWLIAISYTSGQTITLDKCLEMAKQNYPLIKQYTLIEKTKEYSIANAQKGYLPQFNVVRTGNLSIRSNTSSHLIAQYGYSCNQ